ncbi:LPD38 domain-containing protein [Endozoicomonas sp.]|uniref:LPD38 domain-containing protein n=1 Tax=Endozoicomonas sp. TaxID=1892382 RepID=UPI003AF4D993
MNWNDFSSTPLFQQGDDQEQERLREQYWRHYLKPQIPEGYHREARSLFDQHTRRRGNPDSSYAGDLWDALWHGGYAGAADLVSGASRLVGGDGHNAASGWLREKSEEQLDNMSPSSIEAMQGFGVERKGDGGYGLTEGSTAAGFGLQFASGVGSLAPSMIPGGVASKGLSALGMKGLQASGPAAAVTGLEDARRVQGLANVIDKGSHAIGYGATGGLMIGGAGAEDAKSQIMGLGYEQLKDLPRFQELYQQTYEQAGGGDTRQPFEQAKALLAEEAAQASFAPAAGVGALSMGLAGPAMENLILKNAGTRGLNAAKGFLTEGAQEFGEGVGQQMAANYGQQQVGREVGLTDGALEQGLSGAIVGGPVGGLVGAAGRTRNMDDIREKQQRLNDLMSQHQTLQDQMQEPHADQAMLAEQLRQNSLAIAGLESQLHELGETQAQEEQPQAQTKPELTIDPSQWSPGWQAGPVQQTPQIGSDNAIYVNPTGPVQRGETTFTGPGFEQQTRQPEPSPQQKASEPRQQALPYSPPADFTGNRYGTVDADPEAAQQDSQQRRQDQIDRATHQHPGSTEYTGNPERDLTSYTERMNGLNRLFRSFNWKKGDDNKKRRVRKLIEDQRRLEMNARKSGRGFTPTSMKETLANLKSMVESGDGIRFEREVKAIEARQQQEGMRLTAQEKSGTPSGKKPVLGKADESVMADEREVSTQYALYEQSDLIASHNDTGKVNPQYPAELQPRDRARQASETQIRGIASKLNPKKLGANPLASSGAPIIGSDRVVESGNGRVSAIRKAYRNHPERSAAYRQYLKDNAEVFGLKPGDVDKFSQPVLVRQRQGTLDTEDRVSFTNEANKPETATMSPAEKAKLDAARITQEDLSHFDTDGTGDLLHRSNDIFLARFADRLGDEAGELKTKEGNWNKQMRDRVESALFMKAYGDDRLNSLFAEDDKPDLKNLIKSLAMAAPHFARAKGIDPELGGYGVIDSLVEASRILQDSRNRGQSVDEILDQRSLLDSFSPETELFARWLDANLNKSKQVGQALSELANQIEQYLQKQSQADGDMFGTAEATLDDLIQQTNHQLEKNHGDKSTPIIDPKPTPREGESPTKRPERDWEAQQTGPVQTAEGSNRSSDPEERTGRPTESAREAKRDEVDDLLDAVDHGTLDSDEWTDDDFAGIEEDKAQYDPQDGGSATKRRAPEGHRKRDKYAPQDGGSATKRQERDWYNSRNAPHYSVPGIKSLGGAERAAIKQYLDNRADKPEVIARLKKLADTPWARKTVQSMLIRQTIDDLVAGREVDYQSLLSQKDNASILKALKDHGEPGLWRYLHTEDVMGHAGKPENSINGSFVDCMPSRDCASFCYATKGNYRFSNPIIKSEIVNWAVEKDPVRTARIAANDYKGTPEFYQNKALRLFDMGDGSMAWLPFIRTMNKEGIRLQIFSKNPEFLKQVPEQNWRALSVDNSNFELAAQHPELPLAVVFDGQQKGIDFVRSNLDRILVILPIKHGQRVLGDKAALRRMLGLDAMKRLCPVDGGWKKIKHPTDPKKNFNCTSCDQYGGMGCFHGNVTRQVMKAATEAPHDKHLQRLKEEIENDPDRFGGKASAAELLGNLGKIRSALRASADTRTEATDAGGQGQEAEGTIGVRQIDEGTGRYRVGEGEEGKIEERKRRGKKSDLEDAGQKDLFASPDLSGDERKQQIIENQRVLVRHVETGTIRAGTDTIHTYDDLAHFIAPIRKLAQEEMIAIVLDGNNKVINVIKHSKGQKASASVSPWTLAGAVVATPNAKSVWFAHNHPSGDPEPSMSDVHITHSLNDVLDGSGVVNMGHAVVGTTGHAKIMDADGTVLMGTVAPKRMARNKAFPITERRLRFNRPYINFGSPEAVRPFLDTISPNAVVLLDSKYNVTGVLPLSENDLKTLRHPTKNPAAARIMQALDSTNSSSVILKSNGSPLAMKGTRNLINFFNRADRIQVLDHFTGRDGSYQSAAEKGFPDLNERGSFYALRKDSSARGIQSGPLRLKLKPLEQKLGQSIHVLQSETELPYSLYQKVISDKAQGRGRGMFDPETGETYLIAANLDTTGEAVRTVLHELVGHKGVRGLLGKRLDTVLDEIHRDMNDRLKQALGKRYARQTEGKSEAEANRIIAEEYLAHLAEKDPKNGLLTKVVSMIRNALRRLFPNIKWTDADAVELLSAARGHLKRNGNLNAGNAKGNRYSDSGIAPTFYSAVERSAAAVKSDKLPAQSWLNAIKKGNNVQDEEVQWLGLDLWLADKKGEKLTRAEVLDFIRQNEVRISEDWNVDSFDEQELEDRLESKQRDFIRERIDDYEHGYSLDELGDALEDARESLREDEYDYQYQELKNRFDDEALDDHEVDTLVDDDGYLDESALHEEAQWRANNSVDNMDDKELVRDHISYSDKEDAALEAWENDYESDVRSDLEAELRDESDVQYRNYAMQGGEDYSELLLILDNNSHVFPADPNHKNLSPISEEEAKALAQGMMPAGMKVDDVGWSQAFRDYTLYRRNGDDKTMITTGHATEASAIAAAVSEHQSFARWRQDDYDESHWGTTENVLAHVRFQTFDENIHGRNERILFIDEVQSDLHQAGRESGYRTPESVRKQEQRNARINAVDDKIRSVVKQRDEFGKQHAETGTRRDELTRQLKQAEQAEDQTQVDRLNNELSTVAEDVENHFQQWVDAEAQLKALRDERQSLFDTDKHRFYRQVPNAPLKESWPNLVMKRMIRHAAENGFDRIAWSSAAQQVERYPSLGQVVEQMKVSPQFTHEGRLTHVTLTIKNRNGSNRREHIAEERLDAYVGHRLGAKIREDSHSVYESLQEERSQWSTEQDNDDQQKRWFIRDTNGEALHSSDGSLLYYDTQDTADQDLDRLVFAEHSADFTLENLDELMGDGARGMREFYDKRLANYMKKYTKKWGATLEPVEIHFNGSQYPYGTRPDKVWSVTVTDKMRDSVLKDGQPLFALKDNKKAKQDNVPRYSLKDLPDDVQSVINDIHGGIAPKPWHDRLREWWDAKPLKEHIKRGLLHVNQGVFTDAAIIEQQEKLLNEGKLMDATVSASKAVYLARNLDNVTDATFHKGTPMLKEGSIVIKPGSKGLFELLKPVTERDELAIWEVYEGSHRAQRIMEEDKVARAKGNQLLAQGQALKETLDATAPDEYQGGRSGWNRDRRQMEKDLKLGKELSQQNRENLYDQQRIDTIQNWVHTQPELAKRFKQVMDDYQQHNRDLLDFMEAAGTLDKEQRKLFDTGDYIPFNRIHDLEYQEENQRFIRPKKGLGGQTTGIQRLKGGVEKIAPLEAMVRNTRSMLDAALKNIAQQRVIDNALQLGAVEKIESAITVTDDDVKAALQGIGVSTDLTPAQMRGWKSLMAKYETLKGTTSVSRGGKLETYAVDDPLLLASIQDIGPELHSGFMKLVGIPSQIVRRGVTAMPAYWFRNLTRDTLSTAVHIAPDVNGKVVGMNPLAGAIRGFRKSLDEDESLWAMKMAGGSSSSGHYRSNYNNIRKKLSPAEQKRILSTPGKLIDFWDSIGARFEDSNRLHVFERVKEEGGSTAEAAYQSLDVMNFTRKGQWGIVRFLTQSIQFTNSLLQGVNRMWRGVKPGDELHWSALSGEVLTRGLMYGFASWLLVRLFEDDDRYKELSTDEKVAYHHFWIGDGEDGHFRIPKPFEVGHVFATIPEFLWQGMMGHEDAKWTKDAMVTLGMAMFNLESTPIPQFVKPIWEVGENRDRFRDRDIVPMSLQHLKPEAQYDPYTSETLKELVQYLPEGAPEWMRSPKKLEHLLKGYFNAFATGTLAVTDAVTRHLTGAGEKPAWNKQDYPVVGSFFGDRIKGSTRYTNELYEMNKDVNAIASSIKHYQETGETQRAKELEQSASVKLKNKTGLNKASREISKLRREVRKVMEDRIMDRHTKREWLDRLNRQINQVATNAVKHYQK